MMHIKSLETTSLAVFERNKCEADHILCACYGTNPGSYSNTGCDSINPNCYSTIQAGILLIPIVILLIQPIILLIPAVITLIQTFILLIPNQFDMVRFPERSERCVSLCHLLLRVRSSYLLKIELLGWICLLKKST